ncbi:Beta-1,3-galactosyltransferase brn [Armadillidium nasatum]|uniref:Hexosyltransferase n=1 Tax=Armadillidium nasatum TaxID=96803 RepID=A0A5N5SQR6_9CRUS|nr:Beta-1,3-galactosyltransferase brn [Armadillidium nasatum]
MKFFGIPVRRKCCFYCWYIFVLFSFLYYSGLQEYLFAWSYSRHYIHWGPEESLQTLISQMQIREASGVKPINEFSYPFTFIYQEKCRSKEPIRLMYIVKSAMHNFENREMIRNTWGYENKYIDVSIRTVFLLGYDFDSPDLQIKVEKEANTHKDIIQAEFIDSYYNNTLKAMMGLHWAFHYCENVKYFFFVDDDYYISTRNVLRFLRSPLNYPKYLEKFVASAVNEYQDQLYAGFVFNNVSPIRWYFSKWYVPLSEYPYSHWPTYVTAGAYVLSRKSLVNLYYASLFTKFFRFDDIFLGMAAKKAGIKPVHHNEFHFDKKPYSLEGYKWVIASHGFADPVQLLNAYNEQRSAGNA